MTKSFMSNEKIKLYEREDYLVAKSTIALKKSLACRGLWVHIDMSISTIFAAT